MGSLLKSVSTVSLLTLVSRITGLVREQMIAVFFGASAFTDAFNVAFRIPNLLRRIFAEGAFSQAFVPILARRKATVGDAGVQTLIDHVATFLLWTVMAVTLLGVLFTPWVVLGMASGLTKEPEAFASAVGMTRLMFPYIVCMSLVALAAGVLNTYKRFAVPAFTPVLLNVAVIVSVWLLSPWLAQWGFLPIYSLALGVMVGGVLQLGLQLLALRKLDKLPRIGVTWKTLSAAWQDSQTHQLLRLMGAAVLGVSAAQISLLINTQIASYLEAGSVSWISYSDRLMELPVALIGVAFGVVLAPQLASARATSNATRYSALLDWGLRLTLLLGLPCALALILIPEALISVLFHYGKFNAADVQQTSMALMGWGVGLLGLLVVKILAPAYYAGLDTKTPVKAAFAALLVTQALNVLLVPYLAHAALTLSVGLGAVVNALWLLLGLLRSKLYRPQTGWSVYALKLIIANGLSGAMLLFLAGDSSSWLNTEAGKLWRIGHLALIFAAAAVLYVASLYALKLPLHKIFRSSNNDTSSNDDSATTSVSDK